jgi:hypothetical protein
MSFDSYADLQTAVANWLGDDNLTARIPEFITLGESRMRKDLRIRCRELEATADLALTANTASVALPTTASDFMGVRRLYLNTSTRRRLDFLPPDDFYDKRASTQTGTPNAFTIEGETFVFGPIPDKAYTAKLLYWDWPGAISASNVPTLFTKYPDIYLYAALLDATPYLGEDQRLATWASMFDNALDNLKKMSKRDRVPTASSMQTDVFGI